VTANVPGAFADASERRAFIDAAIGTLRGNDDGSFIRPGLHQYPHQWNWDAALVALGLSRVDPQRALDEVRSLLRGRWKSGMVPHILYHHGASDYFPTPDFWRTDGLDHGPAIATSGLTQPPVLATCVAKIYRRLSDRAQAAAFLEEVLPAIADWHSWLYRARDPEGSGLVAIVHPWESGADNAARWVEPFLQIYPRELPPFARKDAANVAADERPRSGDYHRYLHLIDLFRGWRYRDDELYRSSPFLVRDTLFNAILYRAERDLAELTRELGGAAAEIDERAERLRSAFERDLWDEERGLYHAYDIRNARSIRENSCATFVPLFAGLTSPERAARLVEHLTDPYEYAPGDDSRYLLPSQAKNHYLYEPRRYWRGPVWIHINWMVAEGLRSYGFADLAATIDRHSLDLMRTSGFVEYYDPRDGSAAGAAAFSWSAALALELVGA
jgi:glycogen debranching enzyme